MNASLKFLAASGFIVLAAAVGPLAAMADTTDGSDYHPLQMNSPESAEVQAGAVAAAHATGTEAIGQSTGAPAMVSQMSSDEVYQGAVAASHASGTEAIGQSTALPMLTGASGE
ncbi:hypothetical protein ACSFA8_00810 [Variovorax sp. RT4R15]|uniref:hypothetical protein n=1 Tax=Variovorax sp. RT4R15 TaxID=3443737 RepID=UPI003F455D42